MERWRERERGRGRGRARGRETHTHRHTERERCRDLERCAVSEMWSLRERNVELERERWR
jgi:hypothetical protein